MDKFQVCYFIIAVLWATYQGVRGAVEQRLSHMALVRNSKTDSWESSRSPGWKCWERWVVLYVHDFAFRFVCTMAGFVAFYVVYMLAGDLCEMRELSSQMSALIGFLFLIGIVGVGGQLHYVILLGRVPR
jgi:hypothetical protein